MNDPVPLVAGDSALLRVFVVSEAGAAASASAAYRIPGGLWPRVASSAFLAAVALWLATAVNAQSIDTPAGGSPRIANAVDTVGPRATPGDSLSPDDRRLRTEADTSGICGRAPQVRDAILARIDGVNACADVTDAHLASITDMLDLGSSGIQSLKAGDFAGLSSVELLDLYDNALTTLPAGLLSGLSSLRVLYLDNNALTALPADLMDATPRLRELWARNNALTAFPAGFFEGHGELTELQIYHNPGDPDLKALDPIDYHRGNPLGIYAYLESLGQGRFRVSVPVGTAFETFVSLGVTNGAVANDSITIPAGRLHSEVLAVTPEAGTSAAVTVDIVEVRASNPDSRPWPWPKVTPTLHNGVVIAKAGVLPVEVLPTRKPRVRVAPRDGSDSVTEGTAAVFTLRRDLPHDSALSVSVDVSQTGEVIKSADGYEVPTSVAFLANDETATLTVETQADTVDEENGAITATVTAAESDVYAAGDPAAAEVTVEDDDETRAMVSAVSISSDPGTDGTYAIGDKVKASVSFSVGFSGPLTVSGRPQLDLAVGGATRTATYESGSGTTSLVFAYTVAEADEDTDGIAIAADAMSLNGGAIRNPGGAADLDHAALAADPGHKVEGVRPVLTGAATSQDGRSVVLKYGEALDSAHPPPQSAFAVTANGLDAALGGAPVVSGAEVTLSLASPLRYGVAVAASYTDPGTADDSEAVQDLYGNDAASDTVTVTNNVTDAGKPYVDLILDPASITENGGTSTVTATLTRPAPKAFTVAVAAAAVSPAVSEDFSLSENATLSFAVGATASTGTVEITAVDNDVKSDDKSVRVTATTEQGSGVEPPPSRTLTIYDDEIAFLEVCDRTAQVRDELVRETHSGTCERVNQGDVERIRQFDLSGEGITSLQSGDFSGLTGLQSLLLSSNQLTTLPSGIFSGLPSLRTLFLQGNTSLILPPGVFSGLTGLSQLRLHLHQLPVGLERVAPGRFKATIATGAPFEMSVQISVTNGVLPTGVSTLTIPAGSMKSGTIAVTRSGPEAASVDIAALPAPRTGHFYYSFVKADGLPLEVIEAVPEVTIAARASSVTEGDAATFTLTRAGASAEALTVPVTISETGAVIRTDNAYAAPHEAVFASNSPTTTLTVETQADALDEVDGSVMAALTAGSDLSYMVGSDSTATVIVNDDDEQPDAPTGFTATAGDTEVTLAWTAPDNTGTHAINGYQYRQKEGGGSYGDWADIADSAPGETNETSYTVTGLTNDTAYAFKVRAVSDAGEGAESTEATATPVADDRDEEAPKLLAGSAGATADWDDLTLTYNEALDETSAPGAGAFAVEVAGRSRGVTGVGVSDSAVSLTLASPVAAGETVRVSYTAPTGSAAQPIRDEAGNSAADFTNRAVSNETPGVTLVLSPASIAESGNANQSAVTATLSTAAPAAFTLTVSASGVDPAVADDFTLSASPELSFGKGATSSSGTVTITAVDNAVDAADKAVTVSGTLSAGAKVTAPRNVTLAITDDDETPGAPTGLEATAGNAEVTLAWTAPGNTGTHAINGYQYRQKEGGGSYGDWADIADSAPGETNETGYAVTGLTNGTTYAFKLRAASVAGEGPESTEATATPTPEAELPVVSIVPVATPVAEGQRAEFRVTRTGSATEELTVRTRWTHSHISEVSTGRMVFQPGQRTKTPYSKAGDDEVVREDRTVTLTLEDGEGYTVSEEAGSATVVVEDNDTAEFALSLEPSEVGEGQPATVRVEIGNGVTFEDEQTITLAFGAGTATRDVDYTVSAESLTLAAGASSVSATVTALEDAHAEEAETVSVTARHAGETIGTATLTILDRSAPTLSPPTNLRASDITHDAVTLSWDAPDGLKVTGYQVLIRYKDRDPPGQFAVRVENTGSTEATHRVTGLSPLTRHVFRVKAHTADGRLTPRSEWVDVDTPAAPDDDATRDGATALDVAAASQEPWYLHGRSLDRASGDAVDYYSFTLAEAKELGLGVRGQSIDLDVLLEDATGKRVAQSPPPPGDATMEWLKIALDPGTFYVRVEAMEDGATDYYIRFGLKAPSASASVADARAEEGTDATLDFRVTLDRAAAGTVTLDYATSDGGARAGADYTATTGTLTFAAGETEQTVRVPVLDDAHDEGEETLTLTLSNASGGSLADAEATGTIENADPLPRALLARFGRATALHVMQQVEERLEASRAPGLRGRFAGREIRRGMERELGQNFLTRLQSGAMAAARDTTGLYGDLSGAELLRMGFAGSGDLLTGSGFVLNRGTGRGASVSVWSRAMESHFRGLDRELSLDGGVRTMMFGADYAKGPLMAGLMLSHRRGLGGYRGTGVGEAGSSVTGLHPWVGYKLTERVTLWGVTGYGRGSLSLTPGEAISRRSSGTSPVSLEGGLSMSMVAGGVRGDLLDAGAGGLALAFKADALWMGSGNETVDGPAGRLAATEAVVTRVRTALEASRGYVFGHGIALRPSLEVGVRRDGGDAETGAGADLAASLIASEPVTGLSVDLRARTLLVHEARGFREWGVSMSVSYDPAPSTPLGFVARVAPSWGGQATSGAEALWGRDTMAGLGVGGSAADTRLDAEFGYASALGRWLVGTPTLGVTTSEMGREYRLGYSLTIVQAGAARLQFGLDAQRREGLGRAGADHSLVGRFTANW